VRDRREVRDQRRVEALSASERGALLAALPVLELLARDEDA